MSSHRHFSRPGSHATPAGAGPEFAAIGVNLVRAQFVSNSWKTGASGTWSAGANWLSGTAPDATTDATIAAAGTYTVTIAAAAAAHSLTITDATARVVDNAAFTLGGTLALNAGTFTLGSAGSILGGTIAVNGGTFVDAGGTLNGVSYQGTLSVSGVNAGITMGGSDVFAGTGGTGAGTINLTNTNGVIYALDNTTLDNATLNIGGTSTDSIRVYSNLLNNDTLTLGSRFNLVNATALTTGTIDLYTDVTASGTFLNQGTITASAHNGKLVIYGPNNFGTFTNTGTIIVSNSDTLVLQTNVTTAGLGRFSTATGGTVQLDNGYVLNNAGATLALGAAAQITLGGTIASGTISDSGGGLVAAGGTLSGVTYTGALNLANTNASLSATNGLTVANGSAPGTVNVTGTSANLNVAGGLNTAAGGTAGVINVTGTYSALTLTDTQTLDNATINLGAANGYYASLIGNNDTSTAQVFTLGSHLNIVQAGKLARISYDQSGLGDTLINYGTIAANINGGTIAIIDQYISYTFTNHGSLIAANGGTIELQTDVTTAGLGSFSTGSGSTVQLDGGYMLNNAGSTLALSTATQITLAGSIVGGTVTDAGNGLVAAGGTLSGVTYTGVLNLATASASLSATNGLTVANGGAPGTINITGNSAILNVAGGLNIAAAGTAGVINVTGSYSALDLTDTQTLDNATINLGAINGYYASINGYVDTGTAQTFTFGSHLNIVQAGKLAHINYDVSSTGNTLINNGTITANVAGSAIDIIGAYAGDVFINTGSLIASNNGLIDLQTNLTTAGLGSFSTSTGGAVQIDSTLNNAGSTLALSLGSQLTDNGDITGGTIIDSGGGLAGNGQLSGVTYIGTLTLAGTAFSLDAVTLGSAGNPSAIIITGASAGINVSSGFNVATGATAAMVSLTGSGDYFASYNTDTIDNATISIGSNTSIAHLYNYETTNKASTLTLGNHLSVIQAGRYASIYYDGNGIGGTLINNGTITAGNPAGTLTITGNYAKDYFINNGSLIATAGGTLDLTSGGSFKNLATGTLTGGSYEADAGSTIELSANATITTDAATIILSGAASNIQALAAGKQVTLDQKLTTIAAGGSLALLAGRSLTAANALADNGALQLGGGTLTETSLTIGAGASLFGFGKIAAPISDNGKIEATGGTLMLAAALTGTGSLQIDAGATLEIGGATTAAETVGFNGPAGVLKLDSLASFASPIANFLAGDVVNIGSLVATAAAINGTTLTITTAIASFTETLAAAPVGERIGISADGHNLTAYRYAAASFHTPEPVAFGNHHVGDVVAATVALTNSAAADGYSETLDASIGGSTAGITAGGSFSALAAGLTNAGSLTVGLITSSAGAIAATATIALSTDGAATGSGAPLAIGSQIVNVTGAVYALAQASPANGGTVTLAQSHVGSAVSGVLAITNSAVVGGFSEALDAGLSGASAGFSVSGTLAGLAAGATDSASLVVGTTAAASGLYSGTATLGLISDGGTIDGLGITALASQTVAITGAAYAYAAPQIASTSINLGVVHVGGPASAALALTNAAAANGYSEALDAGWGTPSSGVIVGGTLTGLNAGGSSSALTIGLATTASGVFSGTDLLTLASDGAGIDTLGTTALPSQTIAVTGTIDNYAVAAFTDTTGQTITGNGSNFAINLGTVKQGTAALTLTLGSANAATGLADLLQGTLTATGTGFTNAGFGSFSGLGAGQSEHAQSVTLSTTTAGMFSETIVLASFGTNANYIGATSTETLTVTGTITPAGSTTYTLNQGNNVIVGADGGDSFQGVTGTINSHDSLTGGNGANNLQLIGGGLFDVGAPAVFSNIQTITATEGQAAKAALSDTRQTVYLRNGATETVNVVAGSAAPGNTNPEAITLYDGNDTNTYLLSTGSDALYLGAGNDLVTLGGVKNSVTAGGGTALIQTSATNAGAAVVGTAASTTTLEITAAGTITLNTLDTYLTVKLDGASKLTLGGMGFINVNGGNGHDTITANAANQTLIGGTKDVLNGAAAGTDTFQGASAALTGDIIGGWTTGDVIDLTDMNSTTLQALGYTAGATSGVLTVKDGTHTAALTFGSASIGLSNFVVLGSDGHSGTLIGYH